MDTFDCVIPTREARHARIWSNAELPTRAHFDVRKVRYANDQSPVEEGCGCPACRKLSKANLHALFKTKSPDAGRFATIHNIWFFNTLLERIRGSIKNGTFPKLRKRYLG